MVRQDSGRTDLVEHESRILDKTTSNVDSRTDSSVDERSDDDLIDLKEERTFASQAT